MDKIKLWVVANPKLAGILAVVVLMVVFSQLTA